jgi:hypothetical protein
MIKWERYADHGIVGTAFWMTTALCCVAYLDDLRQVAIVQRLWTVFSQQLGAADKQGDLVSSLITVLSVTMVFSTGLLIDVISPFLVRHFEIGHFKHHFVRPEYPVLIDLLHRNKDIDLLPDLRAFLPQPRNWREHLLAGPDTQRRYNKLITYLIAHCTNAASDRLQALFAEQCGQWRTTRSMGGAIILPGLLLDGVLIVHQLQSPQFSTPALIAFLLPKLLFLVGLVILGYLLARSQFARLCNAMLAVILIDRDELATPAEASSTGLPRAA